MYHCSLSFPPSKSSHILLLALFQKGTEQSIHHCLLPDCGCDVTLGSCCLDFFVIMNYTPELESRKKILRGIDVILANNSSVPSIIVEKLRQQKFEASDHRSSTVKSREKLMCYSHSFVCLFSALLLCGSGTLAEGMLLSTVTGSSHFN